MPEITIYAHTSRAAIRKALVSIPQGLHTGNPSTNAMMTKIGLTVLGHIKQAFIVKSRGGTDEAGDRWAPLSPKTIAYSRRGGRTRTENKRDTHPSQALTKKQQERWWEMYSQGLAIFKGNKASAAKRAWGILKREGATTLLDKYGSRKVEILRDTGLLLNSLSPGVQSAEQVFRVGQGRMDIGTNRKGAAKHHTGIPGKLPQRRLWPTPNRWPQSWKEDIVEQARDGLVDIIVKEIKEVR